MARIQINENLVEIDEKVRIERGPKLLKAIATEELLHNAVTAAHYQVGRVDAVGKPIVLGEEMTYLDWLHKSWGFYVYKLVTEDHPDIVGEKRQRWIEVAYTDDAETADKFAADTLTALAAAPAA